MYRQSKADLPFARQILSGSFAESMLIRFAVYFVPAALFVATVYAFFALDHQYRTDGVLRVPIKVYEDKSEQASPKTALLALQSAHLQSSAETHLSSKPFWLGISLDSSDHPRTLEFTSRHALETTCWRGPDFSEQVGSANRHGASGSIKAQKAGFALVTEPSLEPIQYLCRTTYEGPAKIEVLSWPDDSLEISTNNFHRASGLLEGGLIALSLFVFMFAIINREWTYVIFAGWLIANLRVAALSSGWDMTWMERVIPFEWTYEFRKAAMSGYIAMTAALFIRLFREELKQVGYPRVRAIMSTAAFVSIIEAIALPFPRYVPIMWVTAAIGTACLSFLLARILIKTSSRVALWYSMSMVLNIGTGLYEIIAASFGFRQYIGAVNSVTGAIASSLLAAIAIAQQIRQDRLARLEAQALAMTTLQRFKDTYRALPLGLFTVDNAGVISQHNPAFAKLFDLSAKAAGLRWEQYFPLDNLGMIRNAISDGSSVEMEVPYVCPQSDRWFALKANGRDGLLECSIQDITEKRRATERLEFLAAHDPLTSLPNRRGIEDSLKLALESSIQGARGALAYVDLNRFKLINDLYGHVTGDDVLCQVAQRITSVCGESTTIGRLGGDEFVVVFSDQNLNEAILISEQVLSSIESSSFDIGDKAFQVGATIGLVELSQELTIRDALATADRACREAKQSNRSIIYYQQNTDQFENRISELRMLEQIGREMPFDRLFLEMQPIMSLQNPFERLDFEVLLRMRDPDGSTVAPGKFLSAAEKNGQMTAIDQWVLRKTLTWADANRHRLPKTNFICLNLSGASINDERFVQNAFSILREMPAAAKLLCFEVTEDVALRDLKNTSRIIDNLKALGARVALDDFGAGYTSFNYLKELPADFLKVDGQFVREINHHAANYAIIRAIVELAHQLGMQSIAEWAEDPQAIDSLMTIKADFAQGWVIAKSQAPEAILAADSCGGFIQIPELLQLMQRRGRTRRNELLAIPSLEN